MTPPATPPDEAERLNALRALALLDTPPEQRFDRLTRLAARALDMSYAVVSLVDTDRQWFKSHTGLSVCETPRAQSFCGHTILRDALMTVPDAALDPRFADNPLVTGAPFIRFYAGCPLHAPDGSRIGSLCVLDRRPRLLSAEDAGLLCDLAAIADGELAVAHLASSDALTGLPNRRGFEVEALRLLAICHRQALPVSLLYFDLDGFKQVNDRHGHAAGDRLLVDFARMLRQTFRATDVCGRFGGDEFAVLMCGVQPVDTQVALRRLQALVDAHNAGAGGMAPLAFSVGRGDAQGPQGPGIEALLAMADQRMYERKRRRHAAAA